MPTEMPYQSCFYVALGFNPAAEAAPFLSKGFGAGVCPKIGHKKVH